MMDQQEDKTMTGLRLVNSSLSLAALLAVTLSCSSPQAPGTGDASPATGDASPATGDASPATGDASPATADASPATYATPEEAIQDLADLIGSGDTARGERMFGAAYHDVITSGDPIADKADALAAKELIAEGVSFEDLDDSRKIALLGTEAWPFSIPLAQVEGRWHFDVEAGEEEILNRRIGRNELLALASLRAYVDAQAEYRAESRDGRPPAYARRLLSTEGQHDGLYWSEAEGEAESPLGPLYAEAAEEARPVQGEPRPFNGYRFRILEAQGPSGPGGAKSYLEADGAMTGGHAILAWPAKYGNSGVMSFQTGASGVVFQKDLGPETESLVESIQVHDPDETWSPTRD